MIMYGTQSGCNAFCHLPYRTGMRVIGTIVTSAPEEGLLHSRPSEPVEPAPSSRMYAHGAEGEQAGEVV